MLTPGTRVGSYEVLGSIGAGGMGEVYKARDTRLGRTVALKLLPASAAADPALRERFKREGEAIAAVNDPHICALYGVDRHGEHDVLVMEYVEGEPLDRVLARGPLPFQRAASIALQLASALDAAHRAGIVHRDLKPSNIMLARSGAKILDFGIAKLRSAASGAAQATRAATLTGTGGVVGTVNYMAPEQLQGLDVDERADLFAFGAVLFEMLTGRPAASAPSNLVVPAPPSIQWLIRQCLEKDHDARWQNAHDAAALIKWTLDQPPPSTSPVSSRRMLVVVLATLAAFVAGGGVAWLFGTRGASTDRVSRLSVVAPKGVSFVPIDASGAPQFALSPDGEQLAFVAAAPGAASRIWLRSLVTGVARALEATDNGANPFWSPDNRAVGFFTRGKLKAIDLTSGRVQEMADVTFNVNGGSWGSQGILYAGGTDSDGLIFAPAAGGTPQRVTTIDKAAGQTEHRRPQFLPDGRHFLYYVTAQRPEAAGVYFGSLDGSDSQLILQATAQAHFIAPDWLFFERGGGLVAQRFDASRGTLVGEPRVLPDRVTALIPPSSLMLSGSAAGTLALWDGSRPSTSLEWIDRSGRPGPPLTKDNAPYHNAAVSPDGRRVLVGRGPQPQEPGGIWSVDIASGRQTRLTFGGMFGARGIWSPDGSRIAFGLLSDGRGQLFTKPASGAGSDEPLPLESGRHYAIFPTHWSPDGERIVFQASGPQGWDLWAWHLPTKASQQIVEAPGNQTNGRVSPNGRWLAYSSDESGVWQVYVQSFLAGDGKWQISEGSGSQPLWRADGKELFYLDDSGMLIAATVREQPAFEIVERTPLVRVNVPPPLVPYPTNYSVTPDGQRFLINRVGDEPMTPITVLVNWPRELEGTVPR